MRHFQLAVLVFAVLLLGSLPGVARAETGDPGSRPGHRWGGDRAGPGPDRFLELHGDELGLDAETRAAIEKIVDESRATAAKLRAEARKDHERMRALLEQPTPDEAAVMKLSEAVTERELALRQNRLRAILDIHALLTEEQRAKLVAIRKERRSGRPFGLLRACRGDVRRVCAEVEPGRGMLDCLSENWDDLSPECRESLEGGGRRGLRRGPEPGDSDE